jgi:hypothetical protein
MATFEQTFGPASRGEGEGGWHVNFRIGKNDEFQVRVGDACLDEQLRLQRGSTSLVNDILLWRIGIDVTSDRPTENLLAGHLRVK